MKTSFYKAHHLDTSFYDLMFPYLDNSMEVQLFHTTWIRPPIIINSYRALPQTVTIAVVYKAL